MAYTKHVMLSDKHPNQDSRQAPSELRVLLQVTETVFNSVTITRGYRVFGSLRRAVAFGN